MVKPAGASEICQNFYRSAWDRSEVLYEGVGLVKVSEGVERIGQTSAGVGGIGYECLH